MDKSVANSFQGNLYQPFLDTDFFHKIFTDPPHERSNIAKQMGTPVDGKFPMNGFVENYADAKPVPIINPGNLPPVMGYYSADQVPVTDFFAQKFAICDHWFSSLPCRNPTQPFDVDEWFLQN